MEDTSKALRKHKRYQNSRTPAANRSFGGRKTSGDKDDDDADEDEQEHEQENNEECDVEVWETLSKSFKDVQSVLDHNRVLIKQVNENHQSKIPDKLVNNVALIQEINGNISRVMGIYSDLSVNFSNIVQERRVLTKSNDSSSGTSSSNS